MLPEPFPVHVAPTLTDVIRAVNGGAPEAVNQIVRSVGPAVGTGLLPRLLGQIQKFCGLTAVEG